MILDRQAGIGDWSENGGPKDLQLNFHLGRYMATLPPPGPYLAQPGASPDTSPCKAGSCSGDGPSSADPTPKLTAPSADDNVFHSAFPVFRWEELPLCRSTRVSRNERFSCRYCLPGENLRRRPLVRGVLTRISRKSFTACPPPWAPPRKTSRRENTPAAPLSFMGVESLWGI